MESTARRHAWIIKELLARRVSWRAEDRSACCRLGLILPISKDHMVWTCAAPAKLLEAAGVKFDPSNGGAFRASTQAVSDSPENALDVSPA